MSGLSRIVIKWLQGLDLTYPIKSPKWDLSNGFLIAEIFSWYYPDDINMFAFNTGLSLDAKLSNWSLIKKFVAIKNLNLSVDLMDATMHCRDDAAVLLIESIFQLLTNRPLQKTKRDFQTDLSDWPYQQTLPYHARSTATRFVKNNIKASEMDTDPNLKLNANKAEILITIHAQHRKEEREKEPKRFNVKKTLAERCVQRAFPNSRKSSDDVDYSFYNGDENQQQSKEETNRRVSHVSNSAQFAHDSDAKQYKEIRVTQEAYNLNLTSVN